MVWVYGITNNKGEVCHSDKYLFGYGANKVSKMYATD